MRKFHNSLKSSKVKLSDVMETYERYPNRPPLTVETVSVNFIQIFYAKAVSVEN